MEIERSEIDKSLKEYDDPRARYYGNMSGYQGRIILEELLILKSMVVKLINQK